MTRVIRILFGVEARHWEIHFDADRQQVKRRLTGDRWPGGLRYDPVLRRVQVSGALRRVRDHAELSLEPDPSGGTCVKATQRMGRFPAAYMTI